LRISGGKGRPSRKNDGGWLGHPPEEQRALRRSSRFYHHCRTRGCLPNARGSAEADKGDATCRKRRLNFYSNEAGCTVNDEHKNGNSRFVAVATFAIETRDLLVDQIRMEAHVPAVHLPTRLA